MITNILKPIFVRDLKKLRKEIEMYKDEKNLWVIEKGISNSAGNLCLHLVGNLNTYIGSTYGNTGYVRKRDLEFSLKDIPREELLLQIDQTIEIIKLSLPAITKDQLQEEFPLIESRQPMTTEFFLMHLSTHLSYHLGQVNYHRRLLDT